MSEFKYKPESNKYHFKPPNKIMMGILGQIQQIEELEESKYFITGIEDGWIDGRGKNFERYLKIKR